MILFKVYNYPEKHSNYNSKQANKETNEVTFHIKKRRNPSELTKKNKKTER